MSAETITIKLDAHAYEEEKLCDSVFDQPPFYGINGPEIMEPLSKCRGMAFQLTYDAATTLADVMKHALSEIWNGEEIDPGRTQYAFLARGERFFVCNESRSFASMLKYLDPDYTGCVTFCALISCDAGEVEGIYPLRFFFRSHEAGKHHVPHVHVRDAEHCYDASVRIADGEVIAGYLPSRFAKLAKQQILSEQKYYYKCWNTMTDGLVVDLNNRFGFIQY